MEHTKISVTFYTSPPDAAVESDYILPVYKRIILNKIFVSLDHSYRFFN